MAGLRTGYPGLENTAELIAQYIPPCKIYCEPFAGLGRVAKFVNSKSYILNDKSDFAVAYLRQNLPHAAVTQLDFIECIQKFDSPQTLFFIDPPWSRVDYAKNPKTFCDRGVGVYYKQLKELLPTCKGNWIIAGRASGGARSTVTVYFKDYPTMVLQGKRKINGHFTKVKLASNQPFVHYS